MVFGIFNLLLKLWYYTENHETLICCTMEKTMVLYSKLYFTTEF